MVNKRIKNKIFKKLTQIQSIFQSPPFTTSSSGVTASDKTYLGYLARAINSLWSFTSYPAVDVVFPNKELTCYPIFQFFSATEWLISLFFRFRTF